MKIRTITCHDVYNLGASLQAYALQHYLFEHGHDVEIIDYKPDYLSNHYKLWNIGNPKFQKPIVWQFYNLAKLPCRIKALPRKKVFDEFTAQYLKLTRRYNSFEELKADAPKADVYIAGSDQIWNTTFNNGNDPAFYLDFGDCKKISYAASFATSELKPGSESFVKQKLKNFDTISVREDSGIKILESLGYTGTTVVDPVFLLTKEQWHNIEDSTGTGEDYILVYSFETKGTIQTIAERLSNLLNCKIFSIGPFELRYANKNFVNAGPRSFLSLIRNAKCVISNSFHASAFSMIYNKNFFVVKREDGLNTRMSDLLLKYGIPQRLIGVEAKDCELIANIDYSPITDILEAEIEHSKKFLQGNII